MKVIKAKAKPLDLRRSILASGEYREQFLSQPEAKQPLVQVTGCALFDEDERLASLTSDYLCSNFRKVQVADQTAKSYAHRIGYLLDYLKAKAEYEGSDRDTALLSVTTAQLETYLADLRHEGFAPKTIVGRDAAFQHLFTNYLCQRVNGKPALREDNPYEDGMLWKGRTHPLGLVHPCSITEVEQLILHSESERERCLLQAMYDTGMRVSELPRLTLGAVRTALDFQRSQLASSVDELTVRAEYCPLEIAGSKAKKNQINPRSTLVSRATLERIEDYHRTPLYKRAARRYATPDTTPAFFNAHGGEYTAKSVEKLLDRVNKRAMKARMIKRRVSPHKFRHGSAYLILNSLDIGKDFLDRLVVCSKSHGHTLISTTETYTLIPHDIYRQLCLPDSVVRTKAAEMQGLRDRTFKRIGTGDTK
ncbi:tyrosine-type recombinase/integrase [Pseudomonas aeruginosa]